MKLKILFVLSCLSITMSALSIPLRLEIFDQEKLGELLDRFPDSLTSRSVSIVSDDHGLTDNIEIVSIQYPKKSDGPFSFNCRRTFVNQSPYPSYTECEAEVNPLHNKVIKKNNVLRVLLKEKEDVASFYDAIPFGITKRKFYSYGRDPGVTFEGIKSNVFHYQFICSESVCEVNFSNILLERQNIVLIP